MFEPDFLDMMPFLVTISPAIGIDTNGEISYGTPREYRARISGKYISLRRPTSADGTPVFDIWIGARWIDEEPASLDDGDAFTVDALVELPDDPAWIDGTPVIFAIGRITDNDGHHHIKVQCGWMYHRQGQ